eukprot:3941777-Rhodomonas_salina.1
MVGVVVLEDNNWAYGSNAGFRRKERVLLQITADASDNVRTTVHRIRTDGPLVKPIPTVRNSAVDNDRQIAQMKGLDKQLWVKAGMKMQVTAGAGYSKTDVRNEIERRLNANSKFFVSGTTGPLQVVQFLLTRNSGSVRPLYHDGGATARQLLAAGDVVDWDGQINILLTLAEDVLGTSVEQNVYYNWLRCALFLASIPHNGTGHPTPDCGAAAATNNATMGGFIESFWVQTCNNYSSSVGDCQSVLSMMQQPPSNTAPPLTTPLGFEARGPATRIGFVIIVYINDARITTSTLTVNEKHFITSTLASKLVVDPDWVTLTASRDSAANRRRQLLAMSLTYSISVDDTYDTEAVDLVLLEQQIKSAIESEL